jgi:hypothetical protein
MQTMEMSPANQSVVQIQHTLQSIQGTSYFCMAYQQTIKSVLGGLVFHEARPREAELPSKLVNSCFLLPPLHELSLMMALRQISHVLVVEEACAS